ncbi:MAG: hypothetical protein HY720_16430 [Planctomycetes bacterium]|nr:hypothetical protein [Planctomycetota bacterium]
MRLVIAFVALGLVVTAGAAYAQEADDSVVASLVEHARDLAYAHATPESARCLGPGLLEAVDWLVERRPEDGRLLVLAAELHAGLGYALYHEDGPERAKAHYRLAWDFACRALDARGPFSEAARTGGKDLADELKGRWDVDAPALYWAAFSLGARLDLEREAVETLGDLPSVRQILARVRELAPRFEYGSPELLLAHDHAMRGRGMGGSVEEMKALLEEALATSENRYLPARVAYARDYAVAVQDRGLFEETLREVLSTPPEVLPERAFANRVAQQQARRLLDRAGDYFPEDD